VACGFAVTLLQRIKIWVLQHTSAAGYNGRGPFSRDSMKSSSLPNGSSAQTRIIRAVASSTALETGQSIKDLEALLKAQSSKFQQLGLATSLVG
jgi:hypothetical protein